MSIPSFRKAGEPSDKGQYGRMTSVGLEFIDTYGLELLAGNSFTEEMREERVAIINEEAVHTYGFESLEEAISFRTYSAANINPVESLRKED